MGLSYARHLGIPLTKLDRLSQVYEKLISIVEEFEQYPDQGSIDLETGSGGLYSTGHLDESLSEQMTRVARDCYLMYEKKKFFNDDEYRRLVSIFIDATHRWCSAHRRGTSSFWGHKFSSAVLRRNALSILVYMLVIYREYYSDQKRPDYQSISAYLKKRHEVDIYASRLNDRFRKYDPETLELRYSLFRLEVSTLSGRLSDPCHTELPSWQSLLPPSEELDYNLDLLGLMTRWCENDVKKKEAAPRLHRTD